MNLSDYLEPSGIVKETDSGFISKGITIAKNYNTIKLNDFTIALIGVCEERVSLNKGTSEAPDKIRKMLYQLSLRPEHPKIIDLGNLKLGIQPNDTYYALKEVLNELLQRKIIPIIIGGSQDLTYGMYMSFTEHKKKINLTCIDSRLDIGNPEEVITSQSYISRIVLENQNAIENYNNIGCQSYFITQYDFDLMNKLGFDYYRLGIVRNDITITEPILRDSDIVSIDISAIRQSDAPAHISPSPNGFSGEDLCQFAWYTGMNEKLTAFGIFELNPTYDNRNQTVNLAAQIIWYFIEGYSKRKNDFPAGSLEECNKYLVQIESLNNPITFYQSQKTGRWWIEVPLNDSHNQNYFKIISCTNNDYLQAIKNELPDRLWRLFKK